MTITEFSVIFKKMKLYFLENVAVTGEIFIEDFRVCTCNVL
jgi:hypothetical protein